jgi:hypothetical protein
LVARASPERIPGLNAPLLSFLYAVVRRLVELGALRGREEADKDLEIVVLRRQVKRPRGPRAASRTALRENRPRKLLLRTVLPQDR